MNQASNISVSIGLVRKELETTLQKSEGYFSQYSESLEPTHLKLFADEINLVRGTFKLLELIGAETLTTEMLSLVGDGAVKQTQKVDVLGHALIGLTQYINILLEQEIDHPVLLIPTINQVRKLGGHKPLNESHFFQVNLRPKLPAIEKPSFDIKPHMPRIRLMFQAGLLRVLKDSSPEIGFKLIERSLVLLERGLRGTLAWPFWWSAVAALNAITEEKYELTLARKMLFSRVDMIMRAMIKNGVKVFSSQAANELHKDFLYLVSLSSIGEGYIGDVKNTYSMQTNVTEQDLKSERKLLSGPDIGSYDALSKAINEEIQLIKEALDQSEKNELTEEQNVDLLQRLETLANVLKVVKQDTLHKRIKEQLNNVSSLNSLSLEDKLTSLASIADALLQVELASKKFGRQTGLVSAQEIVGAGHYYEARIILFDEINTGLSVSKRAIGSFVDSKDKLHLANIAQALSGVKGALIFLNEQQAVQVIDASIRFVNEKVLGSDLQYSESKLEVLADVLTSIEYYIETVSQSDTAPKDILNLAIKGIGQLGYKVS